MVTTILSWADYPGITLGNDGNIWIAASGALYRVTQSGGVTRYPNTTKQNGGISAGYSTDVWYVSNALYHYNYATGVLRSYPLPPREAGLSITKGPDGNIWFLTQNTIDRVSNNGNLVSFQKPAVATDTTGYGLAASLVVGPDNNLWASTTSCKYTRVNTSGTTISTGYFYPPPVPVTYVFCDAQVASALGAVWTVVNYLPGDPYSPCETYLVANSPSGSGGTPPTLSPNYMWGNGCNPTYGATVGYDGNLYFDLGEAIGVRILDAISVRPYNVSFSSTRQLATLNISEANYGGPWSASSIQPSIVKIVGWPSRSSMQIESLASGAGRIIVRDAKDNYYNVNITVK